MIGRSPGLSCLNGLPIPMLRDSGFMSLRLIPQKKGASEGSIPSKLPNIISTGVPIFAISDPGSELSEIICESGTGYCADTWNIGKLVNELNDFIDSMSKRTNTERQEHVRNYVKKNFSIDHLIEYIIE